MHEASDGRPGVLFDVDGTLVDTNYLHTLAWSRALQDAGEWAPMHAIHRLIGMGGDELVPTLLGHECPEAVAARSRRYKELADDARAFPAAGALLRRAKSSGLAVVLSTSAPDEELAAAKAVIAAGMGADGDLDGGRDGRALLDAVLDGETNADDVERSKPHPDVFLAAMERFAIDPARAVVVGDSVWDVEAARAAGVGCIGVESGGFSRHELSEAGAVQVHRDVHELLEQFALSPLALLAPLR